MSEQTQSNLSAISANVSATPAAPERPAPEPHKVTLPLGGRVTLMYTREHLTHLYRCSHGELGRLLTRRMAPLPIRVEGTILWFVDEVLNQQAQVMRTLERWRKR